MNPLNPFFIRNTNDSHLGNCRMLIENLLYLPGINILSSGNDHVLFSVNDVDITSLIIVSQITCMKPSIDEDFPSFIWLVPEFNHHCVILQDDLAHRKGFHIIILFINDPDMDSQGGLTT